MSGGDVINVKCLQIVDPVRAAWVINLQRSQFARINGAETADIFLKLWQSVRLCASPRKGWNKFLLWRFTLLFKSCWLITRRRCGQKSKRGKKTKGANEREGEKKHRHSNIVCGLWWSHIVWEGADLGRDTLIRRFFSAFYERCSILDPAPKSWHAAGLLAGSHSQTHTKKNSPHTRSVQLRSCYNKRVVGSRHQKFQCRSVVCCAQLTCQAQR